ncbi:MAG: hypothetical protein H6566_20185 [Lewinellaceae bacterium]|nr:hypothetical protein [Lewinellaceae bacterium]
MFRDTSLREERHTICWNESLSWEGLTLSTDTSLCRTYTGANGCDSTLCLRLEVLERTGYLDTAICEGERYAFGGRLLVLARLVCRHHQPGGRLRQPAAAPAGGAPRYRRLPYRFPAACALRPASPCQYQPAGAYAWSTGVPAARK